MATVITIPRILRDRLSDEGADALVEILNKSGEKNKEDTVVIVEDKFERRLAEEIGKLRSEMHDLHARSVRWMFVFIFGQFWAIVGVLFAFFRQ